MGELVRSLALATAVVASTGAPSVAAPAASGAPAGLGPIHQAVWRAATDEGVSYQLLDCLAMAESTYNPRAVSPTLDYGLLQFNRPWAPDSLWQQTPWRTADPFDADASAHAAAYLIARGFGHRWSTWQGCAQ